MHIRRQSENHIRRPHRHDSQLLGCSCLTLQRCVCMQFGCCPRNSCAGQTCCVTVLTRRPHRSRRNLAPSPASPSALACAGHDPAIPAWVFPLAQPVRARVAVLEAAGRGANPGGANAPVRLYSWHQVGTCAGGTVILLSRQVPPQRPTDGAHGSCPANFLARWRNCTHLQTQMRNT